MKLEPSLAPPPGAASSPSTGPEAVPLVAARCDGAAAAPAGTQLVLFGPDGQARRPVAFGGRQPARVQGETAWWFAPGPYAVDLVPFSAAPELGLRVEFVVDSADPRVARQRFDLFLFSEVAGQAAALPLPDLAHRIEAALRAALAQGTLELPPCTQLDEWNAFRAGLDELLYMRFGVTVADCVPVELGVDYAEVLRRRAAAPPVAASVEPPHAMPDAVPLAVPAPAPAAPQVDAPAAAAVRHAAAPGPAERATARPARADGGNDPGAQAHNHAHSDAAALRRLFLELPEAARTLRLDDRGAAGGTFAARQAQLQRLALAGLDVGTMPALDWAAPGQARGPAERRALAAASRGAAAALDELWAQLARLRQPGGDACHCPSADEELDRIVANLEFHLSVRRGRAA